MEFPFFAMVVFSIGPTALEDWLSGFFPLSCSPERTGEGKGRRRGKGSEREWRRGTEGEGLAPDVKSWRCHCILETIGFWCQFFIAYICEKLCCKFCRNLQRWRHSDDKVATKITNPDKLLILDLYLGVSFLGHGVFHGFKSASPGR